MKSASRVSILLVSCLLAASGAARAQTIVLELRNGDRLSGAVVSENTNRVVLSNAWAKELAVPLAEISRRVPLPAVVAGSKAATVSTNPPASAAGAVAQKPGPPAPPSHWHGDIQLGADFISSERHREVYSGRAKITYAKERFRNEFNYSAAYGRTDGVTDANRMDGSVKTDFDLGRRFYVYSLAGGGYDEIRRIDRRYEVGPGVGYHLLKLTNFVLNVEAGANYQVEERADKRVNEHFFYRLAENAVWKINAKFTLDEKFEFFPRVENVGEYRFRFETNLRYWISQHLSLNLAVLDQYDTLPAQNVTRNDFQLRSSVGIKF